MPEGVKSVYCSAGISHIMMCPNGDVYRCASDFSKRKAPLFNACQSWSVLHKPSLCYEDKCEVNCDLDWSTKWVYADTGALVSMHRALCEHFLPIEGKAFAAQSFEYPLQNTIHIVWLPTLRCGYQCKYCGDVLDFKEELSSNEWQRVWHRIYNRYEYAVVSVSGGEPLLSKVTLPILAMIADKFSIDITTNLSTNTNVMGIVRSGIKPGARTGLRFITGSLHPTSRFFNRDFFLGSLLYLKKNGFSVGVNFVAYPLQLYLAPEYKKWCDEHDISFEISVWLGGDRDNFKARYTDEEKQFLKKLKQSGYEMNDETIGFNSFNYNIIPGVSEMQLRNGQITKVKGHIKNIGTTIWSNIGLSEEKSFKIGAKIVPYGQEDNILKEFRTSLSKEVVSIGEECIFEITIHTEGLSAGIYLLKIDVVKEGDFWFEDRGAEPLKLKLNILE